MSCRVLVYSALHDIWQIIGAVEPPATAPEIIAQFATEGFLLTRATPKALYFRRQHGPIDPPRAADDADGNTIRHDDCVDSD